MNLWTWYQTGYNQNWATPLRLTIPFRSVANQDHRRLHAKTSQPTRAQYSATMNHLKLSSAEIWRIMRSISAPESFLSCYRPFIYFRISTLFNDISYHYNKTVCYEWYVWRFWLLNLLLNCSKVVIKLTLRTVISRNLSLFVSWPNRFNNDELHRSYKYLF